MSIRLAVILVVAGVIASCAGTDGVPQSEAVDLTALQTGPYDATPHEFRPDIFRLGSTVAPESRRLLNYLALPSESDPEITHFGETHLLNTDNDAREHLPTNIYDVATRHRMVAGVYTTRTNGDLRNRKKLISIVLSFPTRDIAAAALADLAATPTEADRVPIPGHPDTFAVGRPEAVSAYTQHGEFLVANQAGQTDASTGELATVIDATLDIQIPLLASQTATPVDDILDIPVDRDRMVARTLRPITAGLLWNTFETGVYEASGELHFEVDSAAAQDAFDTFGVDLVSRGEGVVYRASDATQAPGLLEALVNIATIDGEIADGTLDLAGSRCVEQSVNSEVSRQGMYQCFVIHDRYVASVVSSDRYELSQKAAAQYGLLVRSVES